MTASDPGGWSVHPAAADRAAEQRLGEVQAHAPATGEAAHRRTQLLVAETEAVQQFGGAGTNAVGADSIELAVQLGHQQAVVILLGLDQLGLQGAELLVAVDHVVEGGAVQRRGLLCHAGNLPASGQAEGAAVDGQLAPYQCKKVDLPQPFLPTRPTLWPG